MEDTKKRNNPENKRRNTKNVVFGNLDNLVDYHKLENFEINNKKLVDLINDYENRIKLLENKNDKLVDVVKELYEELSELKEKVEEYGII